MSNYIPSNTGGQDVVRVVPGPVRGNACPNPREILVIEARKVFDFCSQEDLLERCFFVAGLSANATVTGCEITNVSCSEIMPREPITDQEGQAVVSIQVNLTLNITIVPTPGAQPVTIQRIIAFPKRVVLCAPTGTDVTCEVRGTCVCTVQPVQPNQEVAEPNVCCTIQLCVVLTSSATVKALVPSFGMVLPKECNVAGAFGGCPPMPPEVCNGLAGAEIVQPERRERRDC